MGNNMMKINTSVLFWVFFPLRHCNKNLLAQQKIIRRGNEVFTGPVYTFKYIVGFFAHDL